MTVTSSQKHIWLKLLFGLLIGCLNIPTEGYSQAPETQPTEKTQLPLVSLRIMLIPEALACKINGRPHGYGEGVRCDALTAEEVETFERQGQPISSTPAVPPGDVPLDPEILNKLDRYRLSRRRRLWDKKSVLLIFEWQDPQGSAKKPFPVKLKRAQPPDNPRPFVHRGSLPGHQIWLYHESANFFVPGDDIEWTLEAENLTWTFRAKRP